ncbi:MAG: maleylpyruvate isomerase N-terminal domain-containing protein [Actinomycetota bacterium]|nr:maleylpyruvate isomerase N-terminal domain-containing protein [Actinomycetota bacterium]
MDLELDAFVEECQALDDTLAGVPAEAWTRQALGSWDVAQLVAHLVRAATRVATYLDTEVHGDPVVDRVSYWRYDHAAEAPEIARRAALQAAKVDAETLPALFTEGWRSSAERAAEVGDSHVLQTIMGPMRLDEYLATRVLELVVHHTDLRAALDLPAVSTIAAARITMDVLEALLGGPRPRNLGRARFIQVATGRSPSDDPRFPVLR